MNKKLFIISGIIIIFIIWIFLEMNMIINLIPLQKCGTFTTVMDSPHEECICKGLKTSLGIIGGGTEYCKGICLKETCKIVGTIHQMIESPDPIIVYPSSLVIKKGYGDVFAVGILNTGTDTTFTISSQLEKCYNLEGQEMSSCGNSISILPSRSVSVEKNKREIFDIPVNVNSFPYVISGKYSISVTVAGSNLSSPITNFVYITVP